MSEQAVETHHESRWEMWFGFTLAICAAVLAVNELGAGKYGDDELKETNEKANAYMWYQAKGIKESLSEGQRDVILTLIQARAIESGKVAELQKVADKLEHQAQRYKKEKQEILIGSAAVGEENWTLDIDGKLGQVIGAKTREKDIEKLSKAGDEFDRATLCLQLCLTLGAIGLLLKIPQFRKMTFATIVVIGLVGALLCIRAYSIVWL